MKRGLYLSVCAGCAAAGVSFGYFTRELRAPAPPGRSVIATTRGAGEGADKKPGWHSLSRRQRAAFFLTAAAERNQGRLRAMIESAVHDEGGLEFLADLWLHTDPAAFGNTLVGLVNALGPDKEPYKMALTGFMSKWADLDRDKAWRFAETIPGEIRSAVISQLAMDCVVKDPGKGLEFILAHPGVAPPFSPESITGRKDLLPLLQQLPDSMGKIHMMRNALKGAPLSEVVATANNPAGNSSSNLRWILYREAAWSSLEEVMAYHDQATGRERFDSARAVATELLNRDPAAAIEWARANLSGPSLLNIVRGAAGRLKNTDPVAAAAALDTLPENYAKRAGR